AIELNFVPYYLADPERGRRDTDSERDLAKAGKRRGIRMQHLQHHQPDRKHQQSRARKPLPGGSSMRVQNQQGEAAQIRQRANRDSKALSARQEQSRVGEVLDQNERL